MSIFGTEAVLDTDNDGTGDIDAGLVFQPLSNNAEVFEGERQRFTFANTIPWQGEDSEFVLDTLFSEREIDETHQNFIFLPIAASNFGIVNPDGSQQAGDVVVNNAAVNLETAVRPEITNGNTFSGEDLFAIGANYKTSLGGWDLSADLNYSKSEGTFDFERSRWDAELGTFEFSTQITDAGYTIRQTNQDAGAVADLGNPENWLVRGFDVRNAINIDTEEAFKFDAKREIESSFFGSIEAGVRFSSREKQLSVGNNGGDIQSILFDNGVSISAAQVAGGIQRGADNFLDGGWDTNFDYSDLIFPVYSAVEDEALRLRSTLLAIPEADRTDAQNSTIAGINAALAGVTEDLTRSFGVTEDVFAAYFQANIDAQIGGLPLTGDIGVRFVDTDVEVVGQGATSFVITDLNGTDTTDGFDSLAVGPTEPVRFDSGYTNVLPSFNLRLEIAEGMYIRAAASETISRPPLGDFRPALVVTANAIDVNSDGFQLGITSGNPLLEPFESTNFDIGFEYYFGDSSAFYVAAFQKDLSNYIVQTTANGPLTQILGVDVPVTGIVDNGGATGQGSVGQIPADSFTSPTNSAEGDITGFELGLQQNFASGLGYIVNVSTVDSEASFVNPTTQQVETVDFFGVSDLSYNLTGYYEAGPLQARLSYNYRDEFLSNINTGLPQEFVNDEYGQLDASVSYDLSDNLTLVFSAINLNDEDQRVFVDLEAGGRQFYSTSHVGRRFSVGIRGSF